MLNLRRVVGIIAIIAVAGFVFISCEDGILGDITPNFPKELQGTWKGDDANGTLTIGSNTIDGDKNKAKTLAGQFDIYIAAALAGSLGGKHKVTFVIKDSKITVKGGASAVEGGTSGSLDVVYPYEIKGKVLTISTSDKQEMFTGEKQ